MLPAASLNIFIKHILAGHNNKSEDAFACIKTIFIRTKPSISNKAKNNNKKFSIRCSKQKSLFQNPRRE
jgi:hypothetical protein